MICVDSSVWIDLFRETATLETDELVRRISRERVIVGDLVLAEILQGFNSEREFQIARRRMNDFAVVTISSPVIALAAAQNYRSLRARGITIRSTIDTLIATRCIVEGWPLLYSDRDFDPFVAHLGLRSAMDGPSLPGV